LYSFSFSLFLTVFLSPPMSYPLFTESHYVAQLPSNSNPPASASQMLRLQACAITLELSVFLLR
jgi:hypothetical protein